MSDYIHFEDYYKNSFLPELSNVKDLCKSDLTQGDAQESLCEHFIIIFETAFLLLKYYLQNNGLFQFRESDVIREAFTIGFLQDGEEWMKVKELAEMMQDDNSNIIHWFNRVFDYLNKYMYIYDNLNSAFNNMVIK